ncbi:thioredoxin [Spirulina major CS-329]|uniref:thioredoxin family protein n=1 Tax=Spirulina TaxID=1154 RepID=UPI00233126E1|nr:MULTISPECIES: thioredoxin family protein [Spirulina]MDB9494104.1 thioredoxin [Spirulina subsalsa CS-330]MDB9505173.1 thioredoxin [Spirulina major CS-329]
MSTVLTIQDDQFEQEVMQAEQPVLAYFWAAWCGPCKLMSPSIEKIAADYGDRLKVVKLEVDPNPESVKQCAVEGVPALRIFKDKTLIASHEGAITRPKIVEFLDQNL